MPPTESDYQDSNLWKPLGTVTCVQGKLNINWELQGIPTRIGRFLPYHAYSINKEPVRWDRQRIAYTNLNTSGLRAPDYLLFDFQVGVALDIVSFGGNYIIDRYGRRYVGPAGSIGVGPIPGEAEISFGKYSGDWPSSLNAMLFRGRHPIPEPDQLANFLIGWSVGPQGSVVIGGAVSGNPYGASGEISGGVNTGLDFGGGLIRQIDNAPREEFAWDWADRVRGFDRSSIVEDDDEVVPLNDCLECIE